MVATGEGNFDMKMRDFWTLKSLNCRSFRGLRSLGPPPGLRPGPDWGPRRSADPSPNFAPSNPKTWIRAWLSTLLVPLSLPARHNELPPPPFSFQWTIPDTQGCKHGCKFTSIWMFDCIKWILKFEKQSQVSWIFCFHINLHALLQGNNARQLHCSNLRGSPHCCYDVNMSRIQVL